MERRWIEVSGLEGVGTGGKDGWREGGEGGYLQLLHTSIHFPIDFLQHFVSFRNQTSHINHIIASFAHIVVFRMYRTGKSHVVIGSLDPAD